MPVRTIHCKVCQHPISGYDFPKRMAKLRHHYKEAHPGRFTKMVKKSAKTRAKGRRNPASGSKAGGGMFTLLLMGGLAVGAWWLLKRNQPAI